MARTRTKKGAILEAAKRELLQHGYRRASIDAIARTAGIAKGTVYVYFESKEEVFRELTRMLIAETMEQTRKAAEAPEPIAERLALMLEARFGLAHSIASSSPFGAELIDSSRSVCGDLWKKADQAWVSRVAKTLGELELAVSHREAAELLKRSARGTGFDEPISSALLKRRFRGLTSALLFGLRR
ncbi:MAG: TetR/AcrR family transcriptional regulator [Deltaproteobacteria bacterium]|nr:TetR/AcrR family transcriptional regulator [Deltaproteobacteria bacterium]